ncbi:DUF6083 domain-containing protein [Streptacidiphilus rugosus]|uniref:DUF6083 domain-containing protein n=1 Tax=Streptacidiphilus rugosus TaxID=405783 RepID=UPI000A5192F4|nr:DUF6083 domain-containing protein [Streptacidiphilus rugosus]
MQIAAAADDSVWRPEDDPDDVAFHEPHRCPDCRAPLTYYTTNFGLSIALEPSDAPAKDIPSRFRWRLHTTTARNSKCVIMLTAVHLGGLEPAPDEPVRPTHRAVCPAPAAREQVFDEQLRDLARSRRRLARPVQDTG